MNCGTLISTTTVLKLMASVRITCSKGVIAVRAGYAVEYISIGFKTKAQLFDAVKYACISKGANISDIELTNILQKVMPSEFSG